MDDKEIILTPEAQQELTNGKGNDDEIEEE